ncbi:MAG: NADH:flavin oxidoreductase/NADH oxidase family protein, partial [Rhizobiaceae bacterium]
MTSPLAKSLTLPCGSVLRNRIAKSAMTEGLADPFDNPTKAHHTLYRTWDNGGLGLQITGNVMIDRRFLERFGNVVVEDEQAIDALKAWAEAGHSTDGQIWMQISHPGRQCQRLVNTRPMAPSAVQLKLMGLFGNPRAMTETDIADVIARYANTARIAKKAGFDGVQIHGAHGYLISQFLSSATNQRQDKWGGSVANRARFLREVIASVRNEVGNDYPVSVKLNSADFQKGGFSQEECKMVAGWLSDDGIDLLEISGGTYEQLSFLNGPNEEVQRESTRKREAYFLEYAKNIRDAVKVPLMVTGGFRSLASMESAVEQDGIDLVGLARPVCTAPHIANTLLDGSVRQLDSYEEQLVLGSGYLGVNTPILPIKAINAFGSVGFFYWQII